MSTELNTAVSNDNEDLSVTSFFGGSQRGRCLQLTQSNQTRRQGAGCNMFDNVQLDEQQVRQLMGTMAEWLANR